jgi:amino acid adenylation domain-containing protein
MSDFIRHSTNLSPEQQAIRDKCVHPSGTFVEFPIEDVETSIPARFEKIVQKYPDRLAVKTQEKALTYAELNSVANGIARAILERRGNEAEPVALLFRKGAEQVASILGVLKAGKFFVLLDPSFPRARIKAMFKDSLAQLIVTDQENSLLATAVASGRCQLLEFDSIDCGNSNEDPRQLIAPDDLACVLYTSGTTGQPKGVMQNHRHLLHCMMIRTNAFKIGEHDRLSLLASGTTSALMITFNALLNGSALLPFDVQREGATRLASWLMQEKISVCLISAPLFRSLCETLLETQGFSDLRVIRLTSESVRMTDVDLYKKHFFTNCLLATALSSTETGPLRKYLIDHASDIPGDQVPVGYAVDSKEILLLDDGGQDVGINEIGEIVVRSRYLSPGYWRRPDLTEAKFKADPQGGDNRLYFTGDLGLMLPDGCLIHKGRKDFRVKIRGYGVDIAEVENVLRSHAAVEGAVGVARHDESGETRFIAYFTVASQRAPTTSELRVYLSRTLPDYMIPSVFVRLDAMPLTPNGKIDRRALPEPEKTRPELTISYMAPQSELETRLAGIWCEVLCVDRVGIQDNFFDLGGHSLAASRVISRVIQTFQLELPVKALFDAPTVAEMAAIIAQNQAKRASNEELAQMLREVEAMTEQEAQKLLAVENARSTTGDGHE